MRRKGGGGEEEVNKSKKFADGIYGSSLSSSSTLPSLFSPFTARIVLWPLPAAAAALICTFSTFAWLSPTGMKRSRAN